MAKRIISLLLAAVTFALFSVTGFAAHNDSRSFRVVLEDYQDAFYPEQEDVLLAEMQSAADQIGANIGVMLADDLGGISEEQQCEAFIEAYFGRNSSSIVLLLATQGSGDEDYIYSTGAAYDVYNSQLDHIFDAVYYGLDSGVSPNYFSAVEQFCGYLVNNQSGYSGSDVNYGGITYMATLTDYQDALSASEEEELLGVIQSAADNIGANIGVVLSDSLYGKSEEQYTDDYMYEQFGRESSSIVLMLVKEGSGNQDMLALNYHAYDIYDSQYDKILDAVYDGMDSGVSPNYPAAIKKFCSYLENHKTSYNTGSSDSGASVKFHFSTGHIIAIAIALVISIIVVGTHSAGYKKKAPISARMYLDNSRTVFTEKTDRFIREFTTSHKISSSSSSSGGGHHGGGGGHSRSGGHSSHGGRHR